jgi:hypothetical protein
MKNTIILLNVTRKIQRKVNILKIFDDELTNYESMVETLHEKSQTWLIQSTQVLVFAQVSS